MVKQVYQGEGPIPDDTIDLADDHPTFTATVDVSSFTYNNEYEARQCIYKAMLGDPTRVASLLLDGRLVAPFTPIRRAGEIEVVRVLVLTGSVDVIRQITKIGGAYAGVIRGKLTEL